MVTIQEFTCKNPIQMIGYEAGVCYGSDITDSKKNFKRGLDCLENNHGRTWEFPDVYMTLDEYSARVLREFYTHIGGAPTRLQASTRYINYAKGFDYFTPPSIESNESAKIVYDDMMKFIAESLETLDKMGIPKEDSANGLPLGMMSKMVVKINFRTLSDMSNQRMCTRAYHEFRKLFRHISEQLATYSEEWDYLVSNYFMPKCDKYGYCTEKKSCGRHEKKIKNV